MKRSIIELLEGARDASSLKRSEFGTIFMEEGRVPYPTNEDEVTAFIKDRVRLHHDTWIINTINKVLEMLGFPRTTDC